MTLPRSLVLLMMVLLGCKDAPPDKPSTGSATSTTTANPPVVEADTDPDFTHVDRDQLAALCLAARLPPTEVTPEYAALALADGGRVPWLLVLAYQDAEGALGKRFVDAKSWTEQARAYANQEANTWDEKPTRSRPTTGRQWLNRPCMVDESFFVVITGVFFEKSGPHVFAMRGKDVVLEKLAPLPPGTQPDAVFRRAFELTEKLVGGPASIATHRLDGGAPMNTVTWEPWVKAAKGS